MKKLPEISMSEWAEAEAGARIYRVRPQPGGSKTTKQYAAMMRGGMSESHASKLLRDMIEAGTAKREKWNGKFVYWPIKKK